MKYFIFLFLTLLISCGHTLNTKTTKTTKKVSKKSERNLLSHQIKNYYFSSQPKNTEFKDLKEKGIVSIINLRNIDEYNETEERLMVKSLGMNYVNIPFPKNKAVDNKYIDKVTKMLVENGKKGKVLVHCSSGNRVGIWLGAHLYKDHGMNKTQSIEKAKSLGLNKSEAIAKLEKYLDL
jgi:protein tyrosine phosphatase (PTP) superfamily phosphohydrolase (DUF442 family)